MEAEVAQFNKTIQEQKTKLEEQNKIISSNEAAAKIGKQMVKYTKKREDILIIYLNCTAF